MTTPNTAYHPNDHTFAEMSFQLYTTLSWIFMILTILTNGIRSLVTSLLRVILYYISLGHVLEYMTDAVSDKPN